MRPFVRIVGCLVAIGVASRPAAAQKVLLELRPHTGDTISMRLEQQTEVVGKRDASKATAAAPMLSVAVTFSRAIVETALRTGTMILAITDSVLTSNSDPQARGPVATQRQFPNQRAHFQLAPDGSIGLSSDGSSQPKGMSRTASLIPATFPVSAVKIGDTWTREAPLPAGTTQLGAGVAGRVRATFRFDSLTKNGTQAWVSMHGELVPEKDKVDGIATIDDGVLDGFMVVDRDRGWLCESQFTIVAHSSLRQSFGMTGRPMSFEIHLTQHLRTTEKGR